MVYFTKTKLSCKDKYRQKLHGDRPNRHWLLPATETAAHRRRGIFKIGLITFRGWKRS
jgi:hypothetical protein